MYHYWGKAKVEGFHLLAYHQLDVAAVGAVLLENDLRLRTMLCECFQQQENDFRKFFCFILALHDIGKFSHTFQTLIPELAKRLLGYSQAYPYSLRHDSLGFLVWKKYIIQNFLNASGNTSALQNDLKKTYLMKWMECITGHHGKPPSITGNFGNRLTIESFFDDANLESATLYIQNCQQLFFADGTIPFPQADHLEYIVKAFFPRLSWFIAGFVVLCDWIGSDEHFFPYYSEPIPLEDYWTKYALPSAEKAVASAGIIPTTIEERKIFSSFFPSFQPTPLQRLASTITLQETPQLIILEDLTGSGKSEAALMLAYRIMEQGISDGLYFGLPTMATANGMFPRVGEVYQEFFTREKQPTIVLSHSARRFSEPFQRIIKRDGEGDYGQTVTKEKDEKAESLCTLWLSDSSRKTFLADVGVGTIDQALLSVLPSRFQSLRLFGLARKVLIVDEVHAYDTYMLRLLETLLTFHAALGGSAILLSATLPQKLRESLSNAFRKGLGLETASLDRNDYPLLTHISETTVEKEVERRQESKRNVIVEFVHDRGVLRNVILDALSKGKCVCWIRNTVIDAIDSYDQLVQDVDADKLTLFHARFALCDRLRIENSVLELFDNRSAPNKLPCKLLIATQVVEQSLDLDFDVMISDLAPIDLLIQRAGRLHRHDRGDRGTPILHVHAPEFTDAPESDWYSSFLPRAAFVYHDHGRLWLAAKLLKEKKGWEMPMDARFLIESVYGSDAVIPEGLAKRTAQAEADARSQSSLADISTLKVDAGYTRIDGSWLDDGEVVTRLGKKTRDVLLLRWENNTIFPWCREGEHRWEMSKVSIKADFLREPIIEDKEIKSGLEQVIAEHPFIFKWVLPLPLAFSTDGRWMCKALDSKGRIILCEYSSLKGFIIHKQEG